MATRDDAVRRVYELITVGENIDDFAAALKSAQAIKALDEADAIYHAIETDG